MFQKPVNTLVGWFLVVPLLTLGTPASSTAQDETAINLAKDAAALSDAGEYEEAAKLYMKAYRLSKAPILLYNTARVWDKSGDLSKARKLYEWYLNVEKKPDGLERGRKRLSDLLDRIPGQLVVRVFPTDATVEVDGQKVSGAGPHDFTRGTHSIVVKRNGYLPEQQDVEILSDKETPVEIKLQTLPGTLKIQCHVRGARIFVNGKPMGTTPLSKPLKLSAGRYEVEVTAPGSKPFKWSVDVAPGEEAILPVKLSAPEDDEESTSPERSVRVPLSLAVTEGLLVHDGQRTNVGLGVEVELRFAGARWLVPGIGLSLTVESPVNVTIRPGLRWYFGNFPMYVRTTAVAMVTPVTSWAFLSGLGGDIPLWKDGFLRLEIDVTVWSTSVVPLDFALGLGHAF